VLVRIAKGEDNMKKESEERVLELIRENKTLKETNETLAKESKGSISSAAFYRKKSEAETSR
jgi:uncharacterized Fe-S cluster-containing radical SAM superfamily protein